MAEETDVKTEVVAQEAGQTPQDQTTQVEAKQAESSVKKDEEVNWKKAREVLEMQKREIEVLRAEMAKQKPEEDELSKLSGDDIITLRQAEKLAENKARKLFEEYDNQKGEEKARSELSDYDAIVNQENLEKLKTDHPELVETLKSTPRLYDKAKSAYKVLKAFYGTKSVEAAENKEILEKNMTKPRSVNSLGSSGALSQAHIFERGLTPELKKQLLQEMVTASKRT
jgi:hypothetical protein